MFYDFLFFFFFTSCSSSSRLRLVLFLFFVSAFTVACCVMYYYCYMRSPFLGSSQHSHQKRITIYFFSHYYLKLLLLLTVVSMRSSLCVSALTTLIDVMIEIVPRLFFFATSFVRLSFAFVWQLIDFMCFCFFLLLRCLVSVLTIHHIIYLLFLFISFALQIVWRKEFFLFRLRDSIEFQWFFAFRRNRICPLNGLKKSNW